VCSSDLIVPYGLDARYCRTCGAIWDPADGEESPCDVNRPGPWSRALLVGAAGVGFGLSILHGLSQALRPRGFLGAIVWSWIGAGLIALGVAGVLYGLSGAATALLTRIGG
jgi:hypothetical protein